MQQTSNTFVFRPLIHTKHFTETISIELPPIKSRDELFDSFPRFNNDGKHYTPAFVLPVDFSLAKHLDSQIQQLYLKNLQIAQKSTELFSGKEACPPVENKYCSICKFKYDNYKKHCRSINHQHKSKNSNYKKYIQMMCEDFELNIQQKQNTTVKKAKQQQYRQEHISKSENSVETLKNLSQKIGNKLRLNEDVFFQNSFQFLKLEQQNVFSNFDFFNPTPQF